MDGNGDVCAVVCVSYFECERTLTSTAWMNVNNISTTIRPSFLPTPYQLTILSAALSPAISFFISYTHPSITILPPP
eukprot:COSAG01_NODE_16438_length_1236_cov_3.922603_2_plen_76_part_01